MRLSKVPIFCVTILQILFSIQVNSFIPYDVPFSWTQVNYTSFPKGTSLEESGFIPQNNIIIGIKLYRDRMFLTIPRKNYGVPATLVQLPYALDTPPKLNPELNPFPSWEMNEAGDCDAFQYTHSMEVDQFGRMWVLDVGRIYISENVSDDKCPPKLVLIDLKENDKILKTFVFPPSVVSRTRNSLNDLVVGCASEDDCWVYMTDTADAKLIVYRSKDDSSWYVSHPSMVRNESAFEILINGVPYQFRSDVNGIALSPLDTNFSTLYYHPLSSYMTFSVPTEVLQRGTNGSGFELDDEAVTTIGVKKSQAAGMMMDAKGILYIPQQDSNSVLQWNTTELSLTENNVKVVLQNDVDVIWPDSFGMNESGYVYVTSNRIHLAGHYDVSDVNFRVIRFFVGAKSYMFSGNDELDQRRRL